MENNSLEQTHEKIILYLLEPDFIKSENQESDLWELFKCGTKYWRVYLQNKSNETPYSFYIDIIDRAKMHLRNKKHRKVDKSMAILEAIMSKLQIHENISNSAKNRRDYKTTNSTLGNISEIC
jgi:hypothetical protein